MAKLAVLSSGMASYLVESRSRLGDLALPYSHCHACLLLIAAELIVSFLLRALQLFTALVTESSLCSLAFEAGSILLGASVDWFPRL
jgi:hypothetical protein